MMINYTEQLTNELNSEQKEAVLKPLYSCTKIVAGAGTGKTKIISKRFVKLVSDIQAQNIEVPSSRILVITFTEKAANEMKERIIKELNLAGLNTYQDDLWVSTYHGFCSKILHKHAIEANLSPDFELADEETLNQIYKSIIKTVRNNEYLKIKNIDKLSEDLGLSADILSVSELEKLRHISNIDTVLNDIMTIIKKIKSLGLTPKEFLEKTLHATKEFSKRILDTPFGFDEKDQYLTNWENHFYRYKDSNCAFDEAFDQIAKDKTFLSKNGKRNAKEWTPIEGLNKDLMRETDIELYLTKVTALIYAIYSQELEIRNIADFDDLINKTLFIFKNNEVIRRYYSKYFKHLIIDEFQDTNGAQLELIKILLDENAPNITFVGDRKQSIYGFRHAQTENLETLQKYIEEKYGEKYPEIKLNINYRSSSHILNAVNYITTEHLKLDEELIPNPNTSFEKENKFVKNTEITNTEYADEIRTSEAKYIAYEINRLKAENNAKYQDFAVIVQTHSSSPIIEKVLTESGIPSVKKINTDFFSDSVINTAISAVKLFKNPLDEIALVSVLSVTLTEAELYELKKEIDTLVTQNNIDFTKKYPALNEKIISLYEKNLLPSTLLKRIFDLISDFVKNKQSKSILQTFLTFEQEIPLYNPKNKLEQLQKENNLRIFEKIISDYENGKAYTNFSGFLDYFDKISKDKYFELPSVTKTTDAVQIITAHACKGLEFPYVFVFQISSYKMQTGECIIFDLQYGKKPGFGLIIKNFDSKTTSKSTLYKELWARPRNENEKLRLFYVAASRAIKYLNILTAEKQHAEYTKNFPDFVIKETIDAQKIESVQCGEQTVFTPQNTSQPLKIQPLQNIQNKYHHKFSFSKLNCFISCNKKFLLKYKYGFTPLNRENKSVRTGSIVHKLIYNSFLYNKIFNKEEITEFLQNIDIKSEETEKIINLYTAFANSKYSPTSLKDKKILFEKHFQTPYKINDKNIELDGDIDLLIENEDKTYTIIDFKTNENLEKSNEEYQKQLYLYKTALEAEGLKINSAKLAGLTQNGTITEIELNLTVQIKSDFETRLLNAVDCYEGNLTVKENRNICDYCEYNYICER